MLINWSSIDVTDRYELYISVIHYPEQQSSVLCLVILIKYKQCLPRELNGINAFFNIKQNNCWFKYKSLVYKPGWYFQIVKLSVVLNWLARKYLGDGSNRDGSHPTERRLWLWNSLRQPLRFAQHLPHRSNQGQPRSAHSRHQRWQD